MLFVNLLQIVIAQRDLNQLHAIILKNYTIVHDEGLVPNKVRNETVSLLPSTYEPLFFLFSVILLLS